MALLNRSWILWKKILIFLLGLLIFSFSFSWEKIPKKDEFGDKVDEYIYVQEFKEGNIVIYWDKDIMLNYTW